LFIFCEIDNNQYRSGVVKNNSLISSLDKSITSSLLRLFIFCEIDNNQDRSGVVTGVDTSKTTINTAVVSLPVSTPQKQQSIPQYTQLQHPARGPGDSS
jgi:molybdopterin/thiamine biosynthesis adenylyltransferase